MIGKVIEAAIKYFDGDVRRVSHFLKVYGYAKTIGELEGLTGRELDILEVAAVLHDIGIKISELKYNSSAGKYQELEGPAVARELLEGLGFENSFIERVEYLIGNHHTYDFIDGLDYQILVEADFLVNADEDKMSKDAINNVLERLYETETGKLLLKSNFKL